MAVEEEGLASVKPALTCVGGHLHVVTPYCASRVSGHHRGN